MQRAQFNLLNYAAYMRLPYTTFAV